MKKISNIKAGSEVKFQMLSEMYIKLATMAAQMDIVQLINGTHNDQVNLLMHDTFMQLTELLEEAAGSADKPADK